MEEQAQKLVDATARAFTGGNTAKPLGKPGMGPPMGAPMMPAMMGRPPMVGAPVGGMRGPMPPFGFPGTVSSPHFLWLRSFILWKPSLHVPISDAAVWCADGYASNARAAGSLSSRTSALVDIGPVF